METFVKQRLIFSLSLALAIGVIAVPTKAAVIYSSETQDHGFNDVEPGSGDNSYYYDMGGSGGHSDGPRVGGTFGAGGGINGAGGGGGGGGGRGGRSAGFASFSSGGGGDTGCTANCGKYVPPYEQPKTNETSMSSESRIVSLDSSVDPVPEPATLAILGAGLMGLGLMRRRRK